MLAGDAREFGGHVRRLELALDIDQEAQDIEVHVDGERGRPATLAKPFLRFDPFEHGGAEPAKLGWDSQVGVAALAQPRIILMRKRPFLIMPRRALREIVAQRRCQLHKALAALNLMLIHDRPPPTPNRLCRRVPSASSKLRLCLRFCKGLRAVMSLRLNLHHSLAAARESCKHIERRAAKTNCGV